MHEKIWRFLAQILNDRNDLVHIVKPFFENLNNKNMNNENINDQKYIPFLKSLFNHQKKVLYKNEVITEEIYHSIIDFPNRKEDNNKNQSLETIILGDQNEELHTLIQEKGIEPFKIIIQPFKEVKVMKIPLIQYCIMKNAIKCFKYLLINGKDDPEKFMEEGDFYNEGYSLIDQTRYKWNSMNTAIYFGNLEIVKILEDKGKEKGIKMGRNPANVEAAILSYRNEIVKKIMDEMENDEEFPTLMNNILIMSARYNNIIMAEIALSKGADINAKDIIYLNIIILFLINFI